MGQAGLPEACEPQGSHRSPQGDTPLLLTTPSLFFPHPRHLAGLPQREGQRETVTPSKLQQAGVAVPISGGVRPLWPPRPPPPSVVSLRAGAECREGQATHCAPAPTASLLSCSLNQYSLSPS